ncbi:MAG: hypothetical protein ACP5LW_06700 [Nitrososphaeria archaeon]
MGVVTSNGVMAQQNWGVPVTASADWHRVYSTFFAWCYYGFGSPSSYFLNNLVALLQAAVFGNSLLASLQIRIMPAIYLAASGISLFALARHYRLSSVASFVAGMAYMFNVLTFLTIVQGWPGWFGYILLPLYVLTLERSFARNWLYYSLLGGIAFSIALGSPAFGLIYIALGLSVKFNAYLTSPGSSDFAATRCMKSRRPRPCVGEAASRHLRLA